MRTNYNNIYKEFGHQRFIDPQIRQALQDIETLNRDLDNNNKITTVEQLKTYFKNVNKEKLKTYGFNDELIDFFQK